MKSNYRGIALLAVLLTGCTGPQASGVYRSRASYERLFAASLSAASTIGYSVTSVNRADGVITAQQNVMLGHGSAAGLTAAIGREGAESVLRVNFTAPPGTFALGNFDDNVAEYVAAVRTGVPDLHADR
jgi:hypothetical protein